MKKLYIVGAGGFGREVAETVRAINANSAEPEYTIAGFIDDDASLIKKTINDIAVVCGVDDFARMCDEEAKDFHAVIAIASAKAKRAISEKLEGKLIWENIIHPTAVISGYSEMGRGNIFQAYALLGPNARVGNHCCLNVSSTLSHDTVAEDFVSIMQHCDITGEVVLEEGVYVATSASIIPGITIGKEAFIGAGSVVLKNVNPKTRVVGVPAKKMLDIE